MTRRHAPSKLILLLVALPLVLTLHEAAVAAPGPPAWPMERGNPQRSGHSDFEGPDSPDEAWASTDPGPQGEPVVGADGAVYIHAVDRFVALDEYGREAWRMAVSRGFTPVIGDDGTIYVASAFRTPERFRSVIYAVTPGGDARVFHRFKTAFLPLAGAVGPGGVLYFGGGDELFAVGPDGTLRWTFDTGDEYMAGAPAVGYNGDVYLSTEHELIAIRPDGHLRWRRSLGHNFDIAGEEGRPGVGPVVMPDGTILRTVRNRALYAVSPEGEVLWRHAVGIVSAPGLGPHGEIYIVTHGGWLRALRRDGKPHWSFRLNSSPWAPVTTDRDGTIYVPSAKKAPMYAVTPDGKLLWKWELRRHVFALPESSPIVIDSLGRAIFAKDKLRAFGPAVEP